jgi:hypothetical protein
MATPATEADLVASALAATAAQVETVGRRYRRVKRLDDARREHDRRYVRWSWDDDGSLVVRARLPADEGARVVAALESLTPPSGGHDASEIDQRRADALGALIEGTRVTAEVVVHADAAVLTDEADDGACHVEAGAPLAAETVRRMACDGRMRLIADGPDGATVGVGRAKRAIPSALRRALRARDGGCRFPGCTRRRWVDAHHVQHWIRGGPTSLPNLVELCRRHHRLVHEGGYELTLTGASVTVRDPSGRDLTAVPMSAPASGPGIEERHDGLEIGPTTAMARYGAGEHPDYVHWIDALMTGEWLDSG